MGDRESHLSIMDDGLRGCLAPSSEAVLGGLREQPPQTPGKEHFTHRAASVLWLRWSRVARRNEIIPIITWRVLPLQPRSTDEAETQPQTLSGGAQSHCGVLLARHRRAVPASNGLADVTQRSQAPTLGVLTKALAHLGNFQWVL